jgi:YVTN family beta-propeller protein
MFKNGLLIALLALSLTKMQAQTVVYVSNALANTISIIDPSTNTVIDTIPGGGEPFGIVFSPDGARAFVADFAMGAISVIDTSSKTIVSTITLPPGSFPSFPAITPDGKSLYVPTFFSGNVLVISTATNKVTATIPIGLLPGAVVITPDGEHAYVWSGQNVSVIDTHTNKVVQSIPVNSAGGPALDAIAITPNGENVYVAGQGADDIQVISTTSNTVVKTLPFTQSISGFAITPDGRKVYASFFPFESLVVIDTATNTVEDPNLPVDGIHPLNLAATPDGALVYVTNADSDTVSAISTATNTVVATIPVGRNPIGIAIANLSTPFEDFTVKDLDINKHQVRVRGDLALGTKSGGLDFAHQPTSLSVGNFSLTIPAGKVSQDGRKQRFFFNGTINGLRVEFELEAKGEHGSNTSFEFRIQVIGVDVNTTDPATVTLKIGHNTGTTTAHFDRKDFDKD